MSLPSWERGLKCLELCFRLAGETVAPLVGAWIEIKKMASQEKICPVAPLVGAWIEIYEIAKQLEIYVVAPLVGAWIEIADTL